MTFFLVSFTMIIGDKKLNRFNFSFFNDHFFPLYASRRYCLNGVCAILEKACEKYSCFQRGSIAYFDQRSRNVNKQRKQTSYGK